MQKIPTIFERDWNGNPSRVTTVPNPEAAWVFAGEGVATQKLDGTACLVKDGKLFARYELKPGKTAPEGFFPAQEVDPETGKQPGWIPVSEDSQFKWHQIALQGAASDEGFILPDGTYELIGEGVQGNAEGLPYTCLVLHGCIALEVPTDYAGVMAYLSCHEIEGIVWHHPDGRMAKIKRRDFGLPWPIKVTTIAA